MELITPVKELLLRSWSFLFNFLTATVIFVVGWLIAKLIKLLVVKALKAIRLDSVAEQAKIADFLSKGGVKYTLSELIGVILYWILLFGVLISALNVLALTGVSGFLDRILAYLPSVIGAIIILILGIFISVFVESIVRTTIANVGLNQANLLAKVAQVAIVVFSILIALDELKIGTVLVSAMSIILASLGLALGLAFGLGSKEIAGRFVSDLIEKLKKK
ncbi:MAG: hypothetical protein Q8O13_08085 [Candidatus Omnitrophota bacterium]|nr:hypothetical protein [Candidatus Omnitrophota bacterium]